MIYQRGIRGAISVDSNTSDSIKAATVTLLNKMIESNSVNVEDISHVIFTLTKDLSAAFPAKFARTELGWDNVAMMCFNELDVEHSLKMCMRVLLVVSTKKKQNEINHIYLKEAVKLRPDIV